MEYYNNKVNFNRGTNKNRNTTFTTINICTMRLYFTFFFLSFGLFLHAQEEILLMNGKQYKGIAIDTSGVKIIFNKMSVNNKIKTKSFFRDEVFSINYGLEEVVFFYPNMYFVDDYTIENMRMVVNGRKDARYHFKTKWVMPVGFVVGAASAVLMQGSIFTLLVPIAYTGIVQIPLVKIQKESISSPEFIGNGFYAEGYNRTARMKRTKQALLSSFVGILSGFLAYELTQ